MHTIYVNGIVKCKATEGEWHLISVWISLPVMLRRCGSRARPSHTRYHDDNTAKNIQYRRKWKGQTGFKLNELNKHWRASVHLANKTTPGLPLSYVDSSSRKRYPAVYFQYPVKCECPKKVITVRRLAFPHARPNIPLQTDRINAQLEWIRGLWDAI